MKSINESRYELAPGTQVRTEDFGLLFYTMAGPRLYFLSCGQALEPDFFQGRFTLDQWLSRCTGPNSISQARISEIGKSLNQLEDKGVILEC